LGTKAAQEARGQDVIALAVGRALQYVGDAALEVGVVVGIHGEAPDALAAAGSGGFDRIARFRRLVNAPL